MKKFLRRLFTGVIASVLLVALLGWLTLRASLPQTDGEISVSGLVDIATIQRDAAGIPVITAANRKDLAFATGFAHGQDRYFQMEKRKRL